MNEGLKAATEALGRAAWKAVHGPRGDEALVLALTEVAVNYGRAATTHLYELRDASDEENYSAIDLFHSREEAEVEVLDAEGCPRSFHEDGEPVTLALYKVTLGLNMAIDYKVWERCWEPVWTDDPDPDAPDPDPTWREVSR